MPRHPLPLSSPLKLIFTIYCTLKQKEEEEEDFEVFWPTHKVGIKWIVISSKLVTFPV